jgi:hypothetical protein
MPFDFQRATRQTRKNCEFTAALLDRLQVSFQVLQSA